jgi:hypothetical protein
MPKVVEKLSISPSQQTRLAWWMKYQDVIRTRDINHPTRRKPSWQISKLKKNLSRDPLCFASYTAPIKPRTEPNPNKRTLLPRSLEQLLSSNVQIRLSNIQSSSSATFTRSQGIDVRLDYDELDTDDFNDAKEKERGKEKEKGKADNLTHLYEGDDGLASLDRARLSGHCSPEGFDLLHSLGHLDNIKIHGQTQTTRKPACSCYPILFKHFQSLQSAWLNT